MKKRNQKNVLPALLVLAVVVVASAGAVGLVQSFSGGAKYVIENWNGDVVESGDGGESSLGGITFEREEFPNGVLLTSNNWGGVKNVATGSTDFSATDLCTYSTWKVDGDGYASAAAYRFPTGTSIINRCLPNIGDERRILVWNSSVDEVFSLNFTTNAYLDALIASSSTNAANDLFDNVTTDAGVWIKMLNFDGSSVSITFEEVRDSD